MAATLHYKMVFEDSGVLSGGSATFIDPVGNIFPTMRMNPTVNYPDINDDAGLLDDPPLATGVGDPTTPGGNLVAAMKDADSFARQYKRRVVIVKITDGTIAWDSADPARFTSLVDAQVTEPIWLAKEYGTPVGTTTKAFVMYP